MANQVFGIFQSKILAHIAVRAVISIIPIKIRIILQFTRSAYIVSELCIISVEMSPNWHHIRGFINKTLSVPAYSRGSINKALYSTRTLGKWHYISSRPLQREDKGSVFPLPRYRDGIYILCLPDHSRGKISNNIYHQSTCLSVFLSIYVSICTIYVDALTLDEEKNYMYWWLER